MATGESQGLLLSPASILRWFRVKDIVCDHVADKLICLVHVNLYTFQCVLAGKLYLNGTSAKHIYFDSETVVGKDAFDRQASLL